MVGQKSSGVGSPVQAGKEQQMLKFKPGHPGTSEGKAGGRKEKEGMAQGCEVGQRSFFAKPTERLTASQPGADSRAWRRGRPGTCLCYCLEQLVQKVSVHLSGTPDGSWLVFI